VGRLIFKHHLKLAIPFGNKKDSWKSTAQGRRNSPGNGNKTISFLSLYPLPDHPDMILLIYTFVNQ